MSVSGSVGEEQKARHEISCAFDLQDIFWHSVRTQFECKVKSVEKKDAFSDS